MNQELFESVAKLGNIDINEAKKSLASEITVKYMIDRFTYMKDYADNIINYLNKHYEDKNAQAPEVLGYDINGTERYMYAQEYKEFKKDVKKSRQMFS